jgi:predicted O-linked N-acetylglucosamine transferase (SPINDLY family)
MRRGTRNQQKAIAHRQSSKPKAITLFTFQRALQAARDGNHAAAIVLYRQTIAQEPNHVEAHSFLGSSLREQGDLVGAIASYGKALALEPRSAEIRVHLAEAQRRLGLLDSAIETCSQVIVLDRGNAEAHLIRGLSRQSGSDTTGAIDDIREAARLRGTSAATFKILGGTLMDAGRIAEAIESLETAAALDPNDYEIFRLLGGCHQATGHVRQAIEGYRKAIALNPKYALTYVHLAGILCLAGESETALAAARIAIRLAPDMPGAYFNLAVALETAGQPSDAIAAYAEALRYKPDFGGALFAKCMLMRQDCIWDDIESAEALAQSLTYKSGEPATPFGVMPMTGALADLHLCNSVYARHMSRCARPALASYAPRPIARRSEKIRVGYLSADFRDHATAALLVEVLEAHDKSRFETFGYSIGRTDAHPVTHRILKSLDHFIDLNTLSHVQAAERIRADDIDLLIDLKGYTFQSRCEILVNRPAPIQVNYLGYPTTMGADFIDYIVADRIVAPYAHEAFYTEKIVHLPNSYQSNDRKRKIGDYLPSRAECGLPEQGFVFCCFNANYKLNGRIFDVWMRLLNQTPGSVLWLLASNERAPENIRKEAASRGVDPSRIVFAPKLPGEDHLARMWLGDLFLDTLPVGAHTTASEALWTGLPVLTCIGEAFPGRVGASLLEAVGLPELITPTLDVYEATALRLARDPAQIADLKARLRELRKTAPLFDTARYVRNYEAALLKMIELRDQGEAPRAFAIEEGTDCQPTPWT